MTTHIAAIISVPIYSQLGAAHILVFCTAVHIGFLFIIFKDSAGNGLWCELCHCDAREMVCGVSCVTVTLEKWFVV
jgi:hypothetical protein